MPHPSDRAVGDGYATHGKEGATDVLPAGPGWPGQSAWRRWRASTPSAQLLSALALAGAVAALGVLVAAGTTRPRQHQRTVYAAARPGPVTVDSAGCPVRVRCAVLAQGDPALAAALHRAFPGADVVSSVVVRDAGSGRTYHRVVIARLAGTTLIVSAQCIPGTRPGPRRVLRAAPAIGGSLGSSRLEIIVPGRGGCSASVEADVAGGTRADDAAVAALADDPALQDTP